ncbi:MAG TPA: sodium-dependent transporter [Methanoregula sp.]|nr:sodium-dependent transporter [Methanoregula sp.]
MERWSSQLAFILAAIGAAVGLGNIWRFSAVLGQNGGGAYLIPYFIAVFVFALPLMILEIGMGRRFRGTVVSTFAAIRPSFGIIGWLVCIVSFLITAYYLVITGWTFAYLTFSVTGAEVSFDAFTGSYTPVLFALACALITGTIVAAGVRAGIERMVVVLVPLSIGILVIMALYSTTLPGFSAGLVYLFTPDFSVLFNPGIWLAAFGQALFSLSVGEGIMLTYGAYMAQDQDIRKSALVITLADTSVALLAGLVIFPVVFSFGLSPTAGAELAFTTLPVAFAGLPFGRILAIAFFALLFFAAITTTVACLEVCVAAVCSAAEWSRKKTATILTGILLAVTLLPALSYSALNLTVAGEPVLDFMDRTAGTLGLHLTAILLAIVFTAYAPPALFYAETGGPTRLNRAIFLLCKYLIPTVLIVTVATEVLGGLHLRIAAYLPGTFFPGDFPVVEGLALIVGLILIAYGIASSLRR